MRALLLVLTISTTFNFFSYSQAAFENGYLISEDGQKIDCLIENLDWKNNPTEFKYKLAGSLEIKKTDIYSVKEFGIHDVCKFIRAKVNIDRSSTGSYRMNSKRSVFSEEQLFLKVLVEGGASLFFYEDGNGRAFFYQTKGTEIKQLIYKEYLTRDNMIATNNSFRQQLYNDLKCQDITMPDLEDIKYTEKSLERIVVKYNVCTNSEYRDFKTKKNTDLLTLTIRPGLNISSLSGKVPNPTIGDFDFGPDLRFRFGIEAEVILPFNNKNKWALIAEPTYQSFRSSKGKENENISGGILVSAVDYSSMELPIGIRHYFLLKNRSEIFINAALVVDFNFDSSIQFGRANGTVLFSQKFESKPNVALGAGYKHKDRYSLEIRYLANRQVLAYSDWNSSYKTLSVIVGYSF